MTDFKLLSYRSKNGRPRAGLLVKDLVFDLKGSLDAAGHGDALQESSVLSALKAWDSVRPKIDNVVASIIAGSDVVLQSPDGTWPNAMMCRSYSTGSDRNASTPQPLWTPGSHRRMQLSTRIIWPSSCGSMTS